MPALTPGVLLKPPMMTLRQCERPRVESITNEPLQQVETCNRVSGVHCRIINNLLI